MKSTLQTAGTVEVDSEAIYREEFLVPRDAVDANGHVNNVVYLRWMQDVAIRHSDAAGVTAAMRALDATWVVRSHHVEYLTPAFAEDRIAVSTWVVHFRRVRSLRRYWFVNASTGKVLVRGETDWVFVDRASGRPRSVPADIIRRFPILTDDAGF